MSEHKEIFISYGREEGVTDFVKKLCTDLRKAGFSVWLDGDIPVGSDWPTEIGSALNHCKILIAIMTKKYVCESIYCRNELYDAVGKRKRVFPVIYGDDSEWKYSEEGAGVKFMIKGLQHIKFQPDGDYSSFLDKLIEAMKSNGEPMEYEERAAKQSTEDREAKEPKLTQGQLTIVNGFKLMERVASNWHIVAANLSLDNIENIQSEYSTDTKRAEKVFTTWWKDAPNLNGGKYPKSRQGLKALLNDSGLSQVAIDFFEALRK